MSVRTCVVLGVMWLASLAGVGVWAQTQSEKRVIAGGDLGFQVERQDRDGSPIGKLVVRINGKWVEAGFAAVVSKVGPK